MKRFIYSLRLILGTLLIAIGLWTEVNVLIELNEAEVDYISTEDTYLSKPLRRSSSGFTVSSTPINQNIHILIGLCTVAGSILMIGSKE